MTRIDIKNWKEQVIVGELDTHAKNNSLVIMSHGFRGDKDEHGRFVLAAEDFFERGFDVLRFDFGGHGESYQTPILVKTELNDLISVIKYAKDLGYGHIGLFGHSLGGLVSLEAYDESIEAVALWAPVTAAFDKNAFDEDDLNEEVKQIDQKEIIENIKIPVLIVHGQEDIDVSIQQSRDAIELLPEGSVLEEIPSAGHDLEGWLDEFVKLAGEWFEAHLPK